MKFRLETGGAHDLFSETRLAENAVLGPGTEICKMLSRNPQIRRTGQTRLFVYGWRERED
jgi:hypothetical protein